MNENKSDPKVNVAGEPVKAAPGDGIRSMKATYAFRAINFELYAKPSEFEEKIENCEWKMNEKYFQMLSSWALV
jgi:hypothetical protein